MPPSSTPQPDQKIVPDRMAWREALTVYFSPPALRMFFLGFSAGLPLLLSPIHIAFLEMVIDPVCSIVFEAEDEEADLMRRPPRSQPATARAAPRAGPPARRASSDQMSA